MPFLRLALFPSGDNVRLLAGDVIHGTRSAALVAGAPERLDARVQCRLFHDLFGPLPFCPVAWLAWNDGTVTRLAEAAYAERALPAGTLDNALMAVLGDALEESGCQDQDILRHCREQAVHVRGCWVLDLVLKKD